jgi:hypothetical protein
MQSRALRTAAKLALLIPVACTTPRGPDKDELRHVREAEEKVRPYSPATVREAARRHVVLTFRVGPDSLVPIPDSTFVRQGNMPYRGKAAGDLRVVFRDAGGRELGSYALEDPRNVRSCDTDTGAAAGTTRVRAGRIEILVPADTTIAVIQFIETSGKRQVVDVGRAIRTAKPQRRE